MDSSGAYTVVGGTIVVGAAAVVAPDVAACSLLPHAPATSAMQVANAATVSMRRLVE